MASLELQERLGRLQTLLDIPGTVPLTVIAADWQDAYLPRLDTLAGQETIEPFIANADLVIFDNRSCLFDPEGEKDPTAWQPAQDFLLSLRRRGKATLLGHHSNRQGGARGHSKPEDLMNLLIKLTRPEDYSQDQGARFVVEFEKSRGAYGACVAPFEAQLVPEGWRVHAVGNHQQTIAERVREYVHLASEAGERVRSANAAIRGASVNRQAGLIAWAELLQSGAILRHHEGGFYAR